MDLQQETRDLLYKIRLGEDSEIEFKAVHIEGNKIKGPRRDALADEIAAFANAGLLPHYLDGASGFSYDGMGAARQGILIVLMVAGRVEILLLPALLLPAQWRG